MKECNLTERYGDGRAVRGEVEFEIRSAKSGRKLYDVREHNVVKVFAKEIIAHRLPHTKVWNPTANGGVGDWVTHGLDLDKYSPKYIVLGASFDSGGAPLDSSDTRYYTPDALTGSSVPVRLGVGAEYDGGLINAIPISEPNLPLKRVERVYFEPSYAPAGTPLLQDDVRAMNNVVVFETTLRKDEYNGFGVTDSDYFTITEVALVGADEVGAVGACECDPRDFFLQGPNDSSILCNASGGSTCSIDSSVSSQHVDDIVEGDQIKLVQAGGGKSASTLNQVSPYYLVMSKAPGGRDMVLDRAPVDLAGTPLTGQVGAFKDAFRIFSHRILQSPIKKSADFEIAIRWRLIMG